MNDGAALSLAHNQQGMWAKVTVPVYCTYTSSIGTFDAKTKIVAQLARHLNTQKRAFCGRGMGADVREIQIGTGIRALFVFFRRRRRPSVGGRDDRLAVGRHASQATGAAA